MKVVLVDEFLLVSLAKRTVGRPRESQGSNACEGDQGR